MYSQHNSCLNISRSLNLDFLGTLSQRVPTCASGFVPSIKVLLEIIKNDLKLKRSLCLKKSTDNFTKMIIF